MCWLRIATYVTAEPLEHTTHTLATCERQWTVRQEMTLCHTYDIYFEVMTVAPVMVNLHLECDGFRLFISHAA